VTNNQIVEQSPKNESSRLARAVIMVATRGKSFRRVASTSQTPKIHPKTARPGTADSIFIRADDALMAFR